MHGELRRTAEQIDEMTIGELALALDDDRQGRRGPEGFRAMSDLEMIEAQRRPRLTPAGRLGRARRG